ncbi:MAG: hypothetical protein RIG63_10205, partial [Coleofasciculus chthonoplastes F3-SA18-01]|uniref:hypothetical protein n=1 Tax=Coleofasciculus chthonoplastes TaxID=64178 RepID=UPI0032F1F729
LELSKLGSILGSFLRVFGLSIAARIDNCKVCRGTKNPRTYRAGSVKKLRYQIGINVPLVQERVDHSHVLSLSW